MKFFKNKKLIIATLLSLGLMLTIGHFALAQVDVYGGQRSAIATGLGLGEQDPRVTVAKIIRVALGFLGIIALGLVLYAGFLWMTANGEERNVEQAKKILYGAVIGLLIILSAFAIVSFVLAKLFEASGGTAGPAGGGGGFGGGGGGGSSLLSCDADITTPGVCTTPDNTMCAADYFCNTTSCVCQPTGGVGDVCDSDAATPSCEPTDTMCGAYLHCDTTSCLCEGAPVIEWLSPVDGADTPNGAPGNFVTIAGRYFGSSTGQVYFADASGSSTVLAQFPNSVNSECRNNWTDGQIIVIVPAGAQDGPVRVVRADSLSDKTDDSRGPAISDFDVNATVRPGLCLANPAAGSFKQGFTLQGNNFTALPRDVFFGRSTASTSADEVVGWSDKSTTAKVPNIGVGGTTVFVHSGSENSNALRFGIAADIDNTPVIDYMDPAEGPVGQYVTLHGRNFKTFTSGKSRVQFFDTDGSDFDADITFPAICADSWWADKQIVVKVPSMALGAATVKVTNSDEFISAPAPFNVTTGTPGPGMCALRPYNGPVATNVTGSGEYFGTTVGTMTFYNSQNAITSSWTDSEAVGGVPALAESGPVSISNSGGDKSNSMNFRVGRCNSKNDCNSGDECCVGSGICSPIGTCLGATANACMFEWTFSTGLAATTSPTCSGYSTSNACMAAGSCPNSPGTCQTSRIGAVGDCGDDACNAKFPKCEGACTYDFDKNICTTAIACNEGRDISGASSKIYTGESLADFSVPGTTATSRYDIEADGTNKVYAFTGKNRWGYSTDFIPVDTTRAYLISARIRAFGANSSLTYMGYQPFDKDKRSISSLQVLRWGNDGLITAFDSSSITLAAPVGIGDAGRPWNIAGTAQSRSLGFYYNGDTSILPDDIFTFYTNEPRPLGAYDISLTKGAYSAAAGNTISLNAPIPAAMASRIILGTTVVKNHLPGGTYLYSGAAGVSINESQGWRALGGTITGEKHGNLPENFRPGTKFVKLIFGFNYDGTQAQSVLVADKVWLDDLLFAPSVCNTVGGRAIFQIDSRGASCPRGTYLDTNGQCSLGAPGSPKLCTACPSGLTCNDGKCAIEQNVCPASSECNPGTGKCENSAATCECCCRVDFSAQDCCTGLTCSPGGCGSDPVVYGQCTGCRVELDGNLTSVTPAEQAASSDACNCTPGKPSRVCDLSGVASNSSDTGVCKDAGSIGASCNDDLTGASCIANDSKCLPGLACNDTTCLCEVETVTATSEDATSTPGMLCVEEGNPACEVGESSCGADLSCLSDSSDSDCRCCCTPGTTNDAGLTCYENQEPCSGASRGLFCGCTADTQCGDPDFVGCSPIDTCCHTRPDIAGIDPAHGASGVCRNPLITATFNQPMKLSSFNGNVVVVGNYGADTCPAGTNYLIGSNYREFSPIGKLWFNIKKLINPTATALTGNWCAITGLVKGYNNIDGNSVLTFAPSTLLDGGRNYSLIVKGDNLVDTPSTTEGVLSVDGIGLSTSAGTADPDFLGTIEESFNGVTYRGRIWSFTTKPDDSDSGGDDGICRFETARIIPNSWMFNKPYSTTTFQVLAKTNGGGNISPTPEYDWSWSWLSENSAVASTSSFGSAINDQQLVTAQNQKDAKTYIRATAKITSDSINNPSQAGKEKLAKARVYVFMCQNPWPVLDNPAFWPWKDAGGNCNAAGATADCDSQNFELYYCRDKSTVGTVKDLPAIKNPPVIRGSGATLDQPLKELFFMRAELPGVAAGLSASPQMNGTSVYLQWPSTSGANKYKIYFGTASLGYKDVITVDATVPAPALEGYRIDNLVSGKKYYFAVTSINTLSNAESDLSEEVSATPADTTPPALDVASLVAMPSDGAVNLTWTVSQSTDSVGFRVYYNKSSEPGFGAKEEVGKTTAAKIMGLTNDVEYKFKVGTYDKYGNETTTIERLATPSR